MDENYLEEGRKRALALGNCGPIRFDADGRVSKDIVDSYWRNGFYVFENVLNEAEVKEFVDEFESMLDRAPTGTDATTDRHGRPAIGYGSAHFTFVKPLSDPNGGTDSTHGRYPAKMSEPAVPATAPAEVVYHIGGILHLLDSALYLYGHPALLQVAEAINGPDFVPFTDTIWVKPAGLGASVSWHQDGTTHWDNPRLDAGTHGFNFMTQLYDTNPANALWVVPGTHDCGKIDIRAVVRDNAGSDALPNAVPMLARAGDVAICNRQVLHGSFANTTPTPRATFVFGFHRLASVEGVKGWAPNPYDDAHISERSKIIALAIDARAKQHPGEARYEYAPLADAQIEWLGRDKDRLLRDYNLRDIGI